MRCCYAFAGHGGVVAILTCLDEFGWVNVCAHVVKRPVMNPRKNKHQS